MINWLIIDAQNRNEILSYHLGLMLCHRLEPENSGIDILSEMLNKLCSVMP